MPAFANADLDTGLIEREQALLFGDRGAVPDAVWLLAALAELLREDSTAQRQAAGMADLHSPWRLRDGWRLNGRARRFITLRHEESVQDVGVEALAAGGHMLWLSERPVQARGTLAPDAELHAQLGERRVRAAVVVAGERRQIFFEARAWTLALVDRLHVGGEGEEVAGSLKAPMPGKVIALLSAPGSTVAKGAPLLVMEAMKMEHTIHAPCAGLVKSFLVAPGDQVGDGADLVELEATA